MPDVYSLGSTVDVLVVTALPEETQSVLDHLAEYEEILAEAGTVLVGYRSHIATRAPMRRSYKVVVAEVGMGRVNAAAGTAEAIRRWPATAVFVVGIGGGIDRAQLGDIVVAEQVVDIAMQKQIQDGSERRYRVYLADAQLVNQARAMRLSEWHLAPTDVEGALSCLLPSVHFAPIFSGDTVVVVRDWLAKDVTAWPKSVGVEMEGAGAAEVVHRERRRFLMIRGVSDRADENKKDAEVEGWRDVARQRAAAYLTALLRRGAVV